MSQINLKSISGITSITTPAGVDNQLTLHTNDTTQRVKVTQSGIEVAGVATATNVSVAQSVTATNYYGSGTNLTGIDATALKDPAGNVKVQAQASGAIVTGILTATTIVGAGTNGIKLPIGTTAQRVNTTGTIRFNSTLGLPEYYNGSAWISIDSPPAVSSVSPTEVESAAGGNITFTINGTRFSVGANVKFISNTGTELTPSSVTRVSATQLTAVIAKNSFVNGQEPYDVKVINSSGLASTLADQINVNNAPAWVTSAGSLGSFGNYVNVNVTVSATDADGDTVTYSIVSGSLPSGLSLNTSTGAITGTMGAVGSSTTVNFTIRATAGGKTADRAFSFVQAGPTAHAFTYTGSDQTWTKPSGVTSLTAYVWSAGGSGGGGSSGRSGGSGGYAKAVINVSSLSALYLVVADGGSTGTGDYNGAGGGYSGIFDSNSAGHGDAVLIAGAGGGGSGASGSQAGVGGGGGGANNNGRDGIGDNRIGQRTQGLGGTTSAGGAAGNASSSNSYTEHYPTAGGPLYGGRSGMSSNGTSSLRTAAYKGGGRAYNNHIGYYAGGSGGSGYYGGGGGMCGYGGGGGGGSGYANGSLCSSIVGTNGSDGNGSSTTAAPENSSAYYASGVAVGGGSQTAGGDGRIVLVY